jgi:hypothetical protein
VSGYDWKDGIGDRRPPRKNPAWKGIEPNDVGIDEFMALCREIGAEPYIAVNTGLGGIEAAAEEVQYVKEKPRPSPAGARRGGRISRRRGRRGAVGAGRERGGGRGVERSARCAGSARRSAPRWGAKGAKGRAGP